MGHIANSVSSGVDGPYFGDLGNTHRTWPGGLWIPDVGCQNPNHIRREQFALMMWLWFRVSPHVPGEDWRYRHGPSAHTTELCGCDTACRDNVGAGAVEYRKPGTGAKDVVDHFGKRLGGCIGPVGCGVVIDRGDGCQDFGCAPAILSDAKCGRHRARGNGEQEWSSYSHCLTGG